MSAYKYSVDDWVPPERLQAIKDRYGEVFVQNAWRRVVDGVPDGYIVVRYPKFQKHRVTGEERIVETEAEHLALFAADLNWELAPDGDGLLERFLKELQ